MIAFDTLQEIPVMERFHTIQGEGFHQGRAAYFIRLAGCDVGCHWCDVKESWTAAPEQITQIDDIIRDLDTLPRGICVITGGEPVLHNLGPLTDRIREAGWKAHLETSGAGEVSGYFDWVCVSPKKFKAPNPDWLSVADELKVIIYNQSDLDWAESFTDRVQPDCELYLQPEWSREKLVLPLIIARVKSDPKWRISLQIHKYLGID